MTDYLASISSENSLPEIFRSNEGFSLVSEMKYNFDSWLPSVTEILVGFPRPRLKPGSQTNTQASFNPIKSDSR